MYSPASFTVAFLDSVTYSMTHSVAYSVRLKSYNDISLKQFVGPFGDIFDDLFDDIFVDLLIVI